MTKPLADQCSGDDGLALYRAMLRIRLVEETIADRYAEQEMRCPVHLSIGQEAIAVGTCSVLDARDHILSTHRCHAHYLAKGGDLRAMIAEIYGKETGCCGGRGGSMHLMDASAGVIASLPIVGSSIPVSVGAALALKQNGSDGVVVGFFGDSAVEEGVFHESLNFAALKNLPVVFVVENNLYAVYTRLSDRQPARPLTQLAVAHNIPATSADGNDVLTVQRCVRKAVLQARRGGGPSLLVFDTYRWLEHCGPNYDNDLGYRAEEELLQWKAHCPIERLRQILVDKGLLSESAESELQDEIKREIANAFSAAKAARFPSGSTAGDFVYV